MPADMPGESNLNKSLRLASGACTEAGKGNYCEAVRIFNQAIELNSKDYRFFVNRSFCFFNLKMYKPSLEDAEKAIELKPDLPKGYYRKAHALAALRDHQAAELTFNEVLRLDPNCPSSQKKRFELRYMMLRELGLDEEAATKAANEYYPVDKYAPPRLSKTTAAVETKSVIRAPSQGTARNAPVAANGHPQIDFLNGSGIPITSQISGPVDRASSVQVPEANNKMISGDSSSANGDKEFESVIDEVRANLPGLLANDTKEIPSNPLGYHALRVENVSKLCPRLDLVELFSKYGSVIHVGRVSESDSLCAKAIIHYDNPLSPAKAIGDLRDKLFPEDVAFDTLKPFNMVLTQSIEQKKLPPLTFEEANERTEKIGECFSWRSERGGCDGNRCDLLHIRINRAIDCFNQFLVQSAAIPEII